jgi:hypothetical protein
VGKFHYALTCFPNVVHIPPRGPPRVGGGVGVVRFRLRAPGFKGC